MNYLEGMFGVSPLQKLLQSLAGPSLDERRQSAALDDIGGLLGPVGLTSVAGGVGQLPKSRSQQIYENIFANIASSGESNLANYFPSSAPPGYGYSSGGGGGLSPMGSLATAPSSPSVGGSSGPTLPTESVGGGFGGSLGGGSAGLSGGGASFPAPASQSGAGQQIGALSNLGASAVMQPSQLSRPTAAFDNGGVSFQDLLMRNGHGEVLDLMGAGNAPQYSFR